MNTFEAEILKLLHSVFSCEVLDFIFKFISYLGDKGAIWIILSVALIIFPKTRKAGICSAVSLILCLAVGNIILKPLIGRVRPYDFDTAIKIIIPPLHDGSFPSGHTMAAFASMHSIAKCLKKHRAYLYTAASLMGLSRIYLCVHYPTDVIFGSLFGICFAIAAHKTYNILTKGREM